LTICKIKEERSAFDMGQFGFVENGDEGRLLNMLEVR
jgi:hypothetical protein